MAVAPTGAARVRQMWDPPCASEQMVTLELHSGARIDITEKAVDAFRALDAVMEAQSYAPRVEETAGYN